MPSPAAVASAPQRRCAAPSTAGCASPRPTTGPASPPRHQEAVMEIAIPLYPRFTALDAVGPYEVLSRLPDARVRFLAAEPGPVTTDNGMLQLVAEASFDD